MEYYYLITGLPDLQADNAKSAPTLDELLAELKPVLTKADNRLLDLLRMYRDNKNLLAYLQNHEAELDPSAILTKEDWVELFTKIEEGEGKMPKDSRLQPYVAEYLNTMADEEKANEIASKEDYLTLLYYNYGKQCKNKFVADWFSFCLDLNNVVTAVVCRKHGFDVKSAVIGEGEVAEALRISKARDFGLNGQIEDFDRYLAVAEESNPLEREKKMDALKWAWLEEHTFFNRFSVECVLSYWIRCELLHRWDSLNVEQGKEIFRALLDDMKRDVKF